MNKWIIASRELRARTHLLDACQDCIEHLAHEIDARFGGDAQKHTSQVITGDQFQEILRAQLPELGEEDIGLLTAFGVKGSRRQAQPAERVDARVDLAGDLIQFKHFSRALSETIQHMTEEAVQRKQREQEALLQAGDVARIRAQLAAEEEKKAKEEARLRRDPQRVEREQRLVNTVTSLFRTREVSFFDAFKDVYDSLNKQNHVSISAFKKCVNTLNLPLNVQDQRILRRIADPQGLGRVDLHSFCRRFETPELRQQRLNKVLDQVATAFYVNNFDLKKAFAMFDRNGDGVISPQEFRLGLASLDIGLHYDEIDELMRSMSARPDGSISYDDFILQMDANFRHRKTLLTDDVSEALFLKLARCLEYSGESLYDSLRRSDFDGTGTVHLTDLIRVLKRIGVSNVEPHLGVLLSTGGARQDCERVDIETFASRLTAEVARRVRDKNLIKEKFLRKLHSLLRAKGLSLFDFFMRLDVNCSSTANKTEMKTGMQALGIAITREEFEGFWKAMHKAHKRVQASHGRRGESASAKQRPPVQEIAFLDLVRAFVAAGCVRIERSTDKQDTLMSKYRQQLKRLNLTPEKAYKGYDEQDLRSVGKNDFIDISCAMALDFTTEELTRIFQIIASQAARTDSTD